MVVYPFSRPLERRCSSRPPLKSAHGPVLPPHTLATSIPSEGRTEILVEGMWMEVGEGLGAGAGTLGVQQEALYPALSCRIGVQTVSS